MGSMNAPWTYVFNVQKEGHGNWVVRTNDGNRVAGRETNESAARKLAARLYLQVYAKTVASYDHQED